LLLFPLFPVLLLSLLLLLLLLLLVFLLLLYFLPDFHLLIRTVLLILGHLQLRLG
jgi:hypothetical protein